MPNGKPDVKPGPPPEPPPQANIPPEVKKKLQEKWAKQTEKYGDKFDINWKYRRVIPKGYRCLTMDELQQEGKDLWKDKIKIK
jgi:hypothetical protein